MRDGCFKVSLITGVGSLIGRTKTSMKVKSIITRGKEWVTLGWFTYNPGI